VIWAPDRNRQQGQLVAGLYQSAAGLPCDRSAIIAGGLPGADKSAALTRAGISRSLYLTVSIAAVLAAMAARALIPAAAGQSPLEAADLVHGEAQYLAKRASRSTSAGRATAAATFRPRRSGRWRSQQPPPRGIRSAGLPPAGGGRPGAGGRERGFPRQRGDGQARFLPER
jgi:hypothetical protein